MSTPDQEHALEVHAHGLPPDCLSGGPGPAASSRVLEVGGPRTDRVALRCTGTDGSWWEHVAGTEDEREIPEILGEVDTPEELERAISEILQQSAPDRVLRIRLSDRVLFLPAHLTPALRVTATDVPAYRPMANATNPVLHCPPGGLDDDTEGYEDVLAGILPEFDLPDEFKTSTPSQQESAAPDPSGVPEELAAFTRLQPDVLREALVSLSPTELSQLVEQTPHLRRLLDAIDQRWQIANDDDQAPIEL